MPRKRRSYFLPTTGVFIAASKLKRLKIDDQMQVMQDWFSDRYMLPDELPYDSSEGGYQWIWGGPYDPQDALESEFGDIASEAAIDKLSSELVNRSYTWSGKPDDSDFYNEYGSNWFPQDLDDPYTALITTLVQIEDAAKRRRTKTDQALIYRLLFANIIIALETYLGDAFSAVLFKRRDFFETFVYKNGKFQSQEIRLSQIFKKLETIDGEVRNLVTGNTWHNLAVTAKWYKQAFDVKLPSPSEILRNGIRDRHDIVHRNGKSTDGVTGTWGVQPITALKRDVLEYATEVEGMLKGLPSAPSAPSASVTSGAPEETIEF